MTEHSDILLWLIGLPLAGCLSLALLRSKLNAKTTRQINLMTAFALVCVGGAALTVLCSAPNPEGLTSRIQASLGTWLSSGSLSVTLAFSLDPLSSVMLTLVVTLAFVCRLIENKTRTAGRDYVSESMISHLLVFGMLVLLMAKNLLLLFLGWECVAFCTAFLLAPKSATDGKRNTSSLTLMRVGSFAFLLAIFLVGFYSDGDLDLSRLEALFTAGGALDPLSVPGSVDQAQARYAVVTMVSALFLVAAAGMSAQFPVHTWFASKEDNLPSGLSGCYACMVILAGIYMLCRLHTIFAISEEIMTGMAIIGAATAVLGSSSALAQSSIRRSLAFLAVGQVGLVFVALGVGAYNAAVLQCIAFTLFMPSLFIAADLMVEHTASEALIDLQSAGRSVPKTRWLMLLAAASLAGLAPLPAFFAKEQILSATLNHYHHGAAPQTAIFAVVIIAAVLSAVAVFRLYYITCGHNRSGVDIQAKHEPPQLVISMGVLMVLSVATLFLGVPQLSDTGQPLVDWLRPVFTSSDTHFIKPVFHEVGLATLLLGIGSYAAWLLARFRIGQANAPVKSSPRNKLSTFLAEGWYLERAYDWLFTRPKRALSDLFANKLPEVMSRSDRGMTRITLLATLALAGSIILLAAMA